MKFTKVICLMAQDTVQASFKTQMDKFMKENSLTAFMRDRASFLFQMETLMRDLGLRVNFKGMEC